MRKRKEKYRIWKKPKEIRNANNSGEIFLTKGYTAYVNAYVQLEKNFGGGERDRDGWWRNYRNVENIKLW